MSTYNRRNFLKTSLIGGVAVTCLKPFDTLASFGQQQQFSSSAAITTGDNRADLAFRALKPYSDQIARAIGDRRVVLKPNNVSINKPLCATR
ncbi:MAG: twin-arginine translocation signal domain-containing protein [Bacteroidales bacterium]|nr:twin-arginine translocation signal domain-containing protein [Bacteroidales bacterium]